MPKRARLSLIGAGIGVVLMVVVWVAAHEVAGLRHADASILDGFISLRRPWLDRFTRPLADLCDLMPYALFTVVPVLVALLRRRPRVAVTLAVILLGANMTTEVLKPLLAGPRAPVWAPIGPASWPSGHATAAMSLALCAVICAPSRLRPAVGAAMAAITAAICWSFLELGWHYPSDVLGGYLVAGTWTLLGIAGLSVYEAHRPTLARRASERSGPVFSVGETVAPTLTIAVLVVVCGLVGIIAYPHQVLDHARGHAAVVVGACVIGALSFAFASGLNLMLRRTS